MGAVIGVIAMGVVLVLLVVGLSLVTINKGYAYKHKIDPLPGEVRNEEKKK